MEKSVTTQTLICDGCPVVTTPPFLRTGVVLRQMKNEDVMKIESNIPIPTAASRVRKSAYTFGNMKVGDSIMFKNEPDGAQSRPARAARSWAYRNNAKVCVRSERGGIRIWRVA